MLIDHSKQRLGHSLACMLAAQLPEAQQPRFPLAIAVDALEQITIRRMIVTISSKSNVRNTYDKLRT